MKKRSVLIVLIALAVALASYQFQPSGGVMNNPNNSALEESFDNIFNEASKDVKRNCTLVLVR